ncbi:hypothetical protein QTP88_001617 [Uroleucon formosanum]
MRQSVLVITDVKRPLGSLYSALTFREPDYSCLVCGRTENPKSKSANISFHRFLTKDNIREQWDNFLVENYLNPKDVTKKLLHKHVFPSIVVGRIKYLPIQNVEVEEVLSMNEPSTSSFDSDKLDENMMNKSEAALMAAKSFGKHKELVTNWTKKNLGKIIPKKYSPAVRQFALSLHFFSGKAYEYVRDQFNTILPHSHTLSKWYSHFNAKPGFTMESLKLLELKVRNSSDPVFCALIMDEMAIRQNLEYDRSTGKYCRVDMGSGIDNDSLAVAKECLVFLVVSINENWKLPIGYFLAHSLNSAQKVELVRHALHVLSNAGVNIISLTFDGCSTNITAAKLLGCNFTVDTLNTSFASQYDYSKIVAILYLAHMIKLVRNAFGEKKIFLDYENNEINFEYVQRLCYLQEQEGCHLANKLRKKPYTIF